MHPDTKNELIGIAGKLTLLFTALVAIPYTVVTLKKEPWLDPNMVGGVLAIGVPAVVTGLIAIFALRSLYRVIRG